MGDRGNIVIRSKYNKEDLVFYTHWRGFEIAEVVTQAIIKEWRWDDPPYLARIIFDELTVGDRGNETGFGISVGRFPDNEHLVLIVDTDDQKVKIVDVGWGKRDKEEVRLSVPFDKISSLPKHFRREDNQ